MKKIHLNRKLFKIHSWLGLGLGIVYLLISIGGASIVFMPELTNLIYGDDISFEKQNTKKLSYDKIYEIANKKYPKSTNISFGRDLEYPNHAISLTASDESHHVTGLFENGNWKSDYINPYTGKIVYQMDNSFSGNILYWLDSLHASLRLGTGGALIVGIVSILCLLSLITGLIFYRKYILKVLLFKVKFKFKNWRTASSDLHRIMGTWALIFNLAIFGSGLYMYWDLLFPSWWKENWPPHQTEQLISINQPNTSIDSLLIDANKRIPGIDMNYVNIARDNSKTIIFYGQTKDKLFLDVDNSGSVEYSLDGKFKKVTYKKWEQNSFWEKYGSINFMVLHTGWAFGLIGKILWTVFGFAPAILSITGFLLWWRRFGKKSRTKIEKIE